MQILERALHATRHINDKSAPRAAFRFPHAFSEKQSPLAVFGRKLMHVFEFFCAASAGNPRARIALHAAIIRFLRAKQKNGAKFRAQATRKIKIRP
jgi:hypothetical protein